jgi:hypothetical protein
VLTDPNYLVNISLQSLDARSARLRRRHTPGVGPEVKGGDRADEDGGGLLGHLGGVGRGTISKVHHARVRAARGRGRKGSARLLKGRLGAV